MPITITMHKSSAFFKRIINRLAHNTKAVVRLNLLRILQTVCEVHPNRAILVERYGLLGIVENLSRSGGDGAVLVRELAREIVPVLRPGLKPVVEGTGSQSPRTIALKNTRRTASETSASVYGHGLVGSGSATARFGVPCPSTKKRARDRIRLNEIPWQTDSGSGSQL
ncbi:hypothetical protein EV421DRAFT_1948281 [Armillaria borealis]|uniref:Uncharacterized protein n=1 Tax=Armillaria borealis TaxID=47425 RepID=A0AA39ITS3_9AGAR|nr:hypothetical protein EV421DRAFT_1948281 [Armillaria borealis]